MFARGDPSAKEAKHITRSLHYVIDRDVGTMFTADFELSASS